MDKTSHSPPGAFIAKLGAGLQTLSLLIGVIGVAIGSTMLAGADGPTQASRTMGDLLTFAAITHSQSIIGLVLITVAITLHRYRAAWMFYFICFYGLLMIGSNICLLLLTPFSFKLHLLFGIFFVGFAIMKKHEFQHAAKAAHKPPSCYQLDP